MDRAGRRPLLLYPMAAMIVVLAVITAAIKFQVRTVNVPLCGPVIAALGSRYRYSEYWTGGLSLPPVGSICAELWWRRGVAVTSLGVSMKLLYVGPG